MAPHVSFRELVCREIGEIVARTGAVELLPDLLAPKSDHELLYWRDRLRDLERGATRPRNGKCLT